MTAQETLSPGSLAQHTGLGSRPHLPGHDISDKWSRFPPQAPMTPPTRQSCHIFSKGEWKRARLREHPRVAITISLDKSTQGNNRNSHQSPDIYADVTAIADTGPQSDLWAFTDFIDRGFTRADLHPIRLSLSAANSSPMSIKGAFFAKLATRSPPGKESSCRSMVYVRSSVQDMYLSYELLLNLGLLSSDFPSTNHGASPCDSCHQGEHDESYRLPTINATRSFNDVCSIPSPRYGTACSCPQRQAPPPRPSELLLAASAKQESF